MKNAMPISRNPSELDPDAADAADAADTAAWAAVEARDSRLDGRFVYAVASTGIYCRPSCPSRRPKRQGVSFFSTPDEAEGAGYRSCRRCRPRSAGPTDPERAVERARTWLDAHLDEPVTLATDDGDIVQVGELRRSASQARDGD